MGLFNRFKEIIAWIVQRRTEDSSDSGLLLEDKNIEMYNEEDVKMAKKIIYLALVNGEIYIDEKENFIISRPVSNNIEVTWDYYGPETEFEYKREYSVNKSYGRDRDLRDRDLIYNRFRDDIEKAIEKKRMMKDEEKVENNNSIDSTLVKNKDSDLTEKTCVESSSNTMGSHMSTAEFKTNETSCMANKDVQKTDTITSGISNNNAVSLVEKEILKKISSASEDISEFKNTLEELKVSVADNGNDTEEIVKRYSNENSNKITQFSTTLNRQLIEVLKSNTDSVNANVKADLTSLNGKLDQNFKTASSSAIKNHEELLTKIKSVQKKTEKIDELSEIIETLEGKMQKLDKLDELVGILSDKGVNISREIPPVSEEEADIINLVRYSMKITEQLGYAARDLIRKKAVLEKHDQNLANEQMINEEKIKQARQEGVDEGKYQVLKALLSKYSDVDTIKDSDIDHIHALWSLICEMGAEIDGDGCYEKGRIITVTENDSERMIANYSGINSPGKYKVDKTGIKFNGRILFRAEFSKVTDNEETEPLTPDDQSVEIPQEKDTNSVFADKEEASEMKNSNTEHTIGNESEDNSSSEN